MTVHKKPRLAGWERCSRVGETSALGAKAAAMRFGRIGALSFGVGWDNGYKLGQGCAKKQGGNNYARIGLGAVALSRFHLSWTIIKVGLDAELWDLGNFFVPNQLAPWQARFRHGTHFSPVKY